MTLTIEAIDPRDEELLQRHVDFENAHGVARFNVQGLREWTRDIECMVLLHALERDSDDGELLAGCATASVVPEIGYEAVQLNAFWLPGRIDVASALADRVAHWEHASRARQLLAHVTDPSSAQVREWIGAGFELVGTRYSVRRPIQEGDADLVPDCPPGVSIVALRDHPVLASSALELWNSCHQDIPTVIPFQQVSMVEWREEMGLGEDSPFPDGLHVAVVADGDSVTDLAQAEVVGISLVTHRAERPGITGHRFSGVASQWRGKGVCSALKRQAIAWAAQQGVSALVASNDEDNHGMRAVNAKLGYHPYHSIVMMRRTLER